MQLFVLDTFVRHVARIRWRAGSYLQRNHRDISRFVGPRNAHGVDHWVWSVTRERVTWLSTRNPRSTLLPPARAAERDDKAGRRLLLPAAL
ncbi:hypothetical protein ALC53_03984 [Atta colombica]|uniref:Uncharacterized protein n=1 Tax=Atta colombica TaxID=520822 RepID=A0A195BLE5_9HYME|nr:hypothetical protein ALC53_03984 [Atta colombica]